MGKKPAAKKKGKALDTRGYATISVASVKKEADAEVEEEPDAEAGAPGAAALPGGPTSGGDEGAEAGSDHEGQEEWERLGEGDGDVESAPSRRAGVAERAPPAESSPSAGDEGFGTSAPNEDEEWERAVERRLDEELQWMEKEKQKKFIPVDSASQFERRGGAPPAGVVVLNRVAEQRVEAALAPLKDEEGLVRMTFPRHWRYKGKLTYERLSGIYAALESLNFKGEQVRWAMQRTLGYDQRAALELLLVNLPKEELPRQFGGEGMGDAEAAAVAVAESQPGGSSPGPPAEGAAPEEIGGATGALPAAATDGAEPGESATADAAQTAEAGSADGEAAEAVPAPRPAGEFEGPAAVKAAEADGKDADFTRRWLTQYCEGSDSGGEELLDAEERLDRERRADPAARHLKVSSQIEELTKLCKSLRDKKRQGAFKQNISADQLKQREAASKLGKLHSELQDLESGKYGKLDRSRLGQQKGSGRGGGTRGSNPAEAAAAASGGATGSRGGGAAGANGVEPAVAEAPGAQGGADDAGGEEMPSLFDGEVAESTLPAPMGETQRPLRAYNIAGWGGRTPKQNLEEFLRKRVWGKNAPNVVAAYEKVQHSGGPKQHRARVTVHLPRGAAPRTFDPEEPCETLRDAENLAAAWALYKLSEEADRDGLKRGLPPTFRQRWQEWVEEATGKLREAQKDFARKRIEFLERLLRTRLPPPPGPASAPWEVAATAAKLPAEWGEDGGFLQELSGPAAASLRADARRRRETLAAQNKEYQDIQDARESLPVAAWRDPLLRAMRGGGALVVSGATGSGKTTQVPQFVLEHALEQQDGDALPNIVVTEPRRISAVSVAKRVSQEMGDPPGGPGSRNSLVGYQIRMEKRVSATTRLLFCTVGVLLRQLQSGIAALSRVTHIFIDEVHERSADCDLLLLLLRQILRQNRPDLRIVLMSATMEVDKLMRYFGSNVPAISIPGRTFSVETFWLEDVIEMSGYRCDEDSEFAKKGWGRGWSQKQTFQVAGQGGKKEKLTAYVDEEEERAGDDEAECCDPARYSEETNKQLSWIDHTRINYDLIEETLQLIEESPKFKHVPRDEGAVLVFLPGLMEITKVSERMQRHPIFGDPSRALVLSLHSVLSGDEHAKAFERPRRGVRKVVLSTNIAETGVTIPDVVFVVDAGKVKCQRYQESTNTSSLKEQFISRAEVMQRRGRAGRVREGFCFHLLTVARFELRLQEMPTPEILRCSLMELMLSVLSSGLQPSCFSEALDPPPKSRIDQAVGTLRATGAVEEGQRPANAPQWGVQDETWYVPTPVGQCLARLPCDLRLGKMALFGALFGGNEAALTVAATLSHRSPLATPFSDQKRALAKGVHCAELLPKDGPPSDHFALHTAYIRWDEARRSRTAEAFCKKAWLNGQVMQTIRDLRTELFESLRGDGFCEQFPKEELTKQDIQGPQVTAALIFAGLYPNVARVDPPRLASEKHPLIAAGSEQLKLHPGSLCHGRSEGLHRSNFRWACYHTKMKTSQVFLRDCTFLTPGALLLFGGDSASLSIHPAERSASLGSGAEKHWHCIYIAPRSVAAIRQLRYAFDGLLRRKALDPKRPLCPEDRAIIAAYVAVINSVDTEA